MNTFTVPEGSRRERADKVLAHAFPEHSRAAIQRAMEAGLVKADGKVIDQSQEVLPGQGVQLLGPVHGDERHGAAQLDQIAVFVQQGVLPHRSGAFFAAAARAGKRKGGRARRLDLPRKV